jgi:hypothetical protein
MVTYTAEFAAALYSLARGGAAKPPPPTDGGLPLLPDGSPGAYYYALGQGTNGVGISDIWLVYLVRSRAAAAAFSRRARRRPAVCACV